MLAGSRLSSMAPSNSAIVPWKPSGNHEPFSSGVQYPLDVCSVTFWRTRFGPVLRIEPLVPATYVSSSGSNLLNPSNTSDAWASSNSINACASSGETAF